MKYVHLIVQTVAGVDLLFITTSDDKVLKPGHYSVSSVISIDQARACANALNCELVGVPARFIQGEVNLSEDYIAQLKEPKNPKLYQQEFKPTPQNKSDELKAKTELLPSNSCMNDAKKYLRLPPYNVSSNILEGDGYFANECRRKHGDRQWERAIKLLRGE